MHHAGQAAHMAWVLFRNHTKQLCARPALPFACRLGLWPRRASLLRVHINTGLIITEVSVRFSITEEGRRDTRSSHTGPGLWLFCVDATASVSLRNTEFKGNYIFRFGN